MLFRSVHERGLDDHLGCDLPEVTVGTAIEVVHGDDVVPRLEEQGDSVGGRQPA